MTIREEASDVRGQLSTPFSRRWGTGQDVAKMLGREHGGLRKNYGRMDGVFQFAHVSRPSVSQQNTPSFRVDAVDCLATLLRKLGHEDAGQQLDIFRSVPQGRNLDRGDLEPVQKILPE